MSGESMTANHVGKDIATFPGSATVSGFVLVLLEDSLPRMRGYSVPGWCRGAGTEAVRNVGRGRIIAVALIIGRWAFNRIRQVLEHEGAHSKRSNQRLLERLEAENAQLRDCVMELMLEIQALHDGAK